MSNATPFVAEQFKDTLGSDKWLEEKQKDLLELFPDNWTHIQNLDPLAIGFKLKLLGVDWKTEMEFG